MKQQLKKRIEKTCEFWNEMFNEIHSFWLCHKVVISSISIFLVFSFLIYMLFSDTPSLPHLEKVSNRAAMLDDLAVRILGFVLLILVGAMLIKSFFHLLVGSSSTNGEERKELFEALKIVSLMGLSGASFFAANSLDELDNMNHEISSKLNDSIMIIDAGSSGSRLYK